MRTKFAEGKVAVPILNKARQVRLVSELTALSSVIASRAQLMSQLGKTTYGGYRDVYSALGYPKTITVQDYANKYLRQDIAGRIVDAYPDATWRQGPQVYDDENIDVLTVFEKAWNAIVKATGLFNLCRRADKIAGIGQYGVLLLGVNDGKDLKEEVIPRVGMKLAYLQPYSQQNATITEWEKDRKSPRYGLPTKYSLQISDTALLGTTVSGTSTPQTVSSKSTTIEVHWTRVLHIADNLLESNIYGSPRLERVWNRLEDLERVVGGSSEMFWRGALPGISFEMDKDATLTPQDADDLEEEIENYVHSLTRYLRVQGMKANTLAPEVADPKNAVEVQVQMISAATGIPQRILLGSERGELASSQDTEAWISRVDERRVNFAETAILRPLIDRLIQFKVLPQPKGGEYEVDWPDLKSLTEKEKAEVGKVRADAMAAYVNSGSDVVVTPKEFLSRFLGFTEEEAEAIDQAVKKMMEEEERDGDGVEVPPKDEGEEEAEGEEEEEEEDET